MSICAHPRPRAGRQGLPAAGVGQDSAGHTGRMGTFSLVREVSEAAREHDTPIVAAGGITTGAHIVAAIALGAVGVWAIVVANFLAVATMGTWIWRTHPRLRTKLMEQPVSTMV